MKAEPGDVVREKLSGNGHIGRVITIDPARKWANVQLRDTVQIFAEHDYDVVFRRGAKEGEPAPRKTSRPKRVPLLDEVAEASAAPAPAAEPEPVPE